MRARSSTIPSRRVAYRVRVETCTGRGGSAAVRLPKALNAVDSTRLHATLLASAEADEARDAIVTATGRVLGFGAFHDRVVDLVSRLRALGVSPGDRVGACLPKHESACALPYATSVLGAVFVPMNPALKAAQIRHIVDDSGMSVMLTTGARVSDVDAATRTCATLRALVAVDPDAEDGATGMRDHPRRGVAPDSADDEHARMAREGRLAALLYTSGSTGLPKGVMVSHENLLTGCRSVSDYLRLTPEDRILAALPFSFDYGLNQLLAAIAAGAACILHDFYFANDLLDAVRRHAATGLAGVPTLWNQVAHAGRDDAPCTGLRYFTNSGGALPEAVLSKVRRVFPSAAPYLMYGLTEAFRSTYLPPAELSRRPGSIGRAVPDAEVLVVGADGELAKTDEPGELVHCGPLVTLGYWRAPDATAERFRTVPARLRSAGEPAVGVWSGDLVRRDAQGYHYFLGRRDALIKTSGYRVSPDEIENVVHEVAGIVDACAFGVPDDALGHRVVLLVVAGGDEADVLTALRNHCRRSLPSYMVPDEIALVPEIAKNANGKHDRPRLVEQYAGAGDQETG